MFKPSSKNNQTNCTVFSIINDDFVENTESFIIQLTTTDRRILVQNNRAQVFISDTDKVTVDFEHSVYHVSEKDGEANVCVVLGEEVQKNVTVRLTTAGDTAEPHIDFTDLDIEITFQPGNGTRICTAITIQDDSILEYDEQFIIEILNFDPSVTFNVSGGFNTEGFRIQGLVVIGNDDSVLIGMETGQYVVEEGDGEAIVCLVLEGQLERSVTVTMATSADTANGQCLHVCVN